MDAATASLTAEITKAVELLADAQEWLHELRAQGPHPGKDLVYVEHVVARREQRYRAAMLGKR